MMMNFRVQDMSCGHCVGSITRAINTVDSNAVVTVDLGQHLVMIDHSSADAATLAQVIADAGYTPQRVDAASSPQT
jgi:copper chaperone